MDLDRLSTIFKALSNPNRVRLFEAIRAQGEASFQDGPLARFRGCLLQQVTDRLAVGAPTVSHHLKELVTAGLVATEREGKQLRCRIVPETLAAIAHFASPEATPSEPTRP